MNPGSPSLAGRPTPYGQSCANCALSKRKCIARQVGGPCERCFKTNKECNPAKTTRRRNRRRPAASTTTRLEEKIDSLVSMMKAGTQSNVTNSPVTIPVYDSISSGSVQINPSIRSPPEDGLGLKCLSDDHNNAPAATPATTGVYSLHPGDLNAEPSPIEAEECLTHFQTSNLQYFPFVYISFTTSAQDLHKERPFLWLCIMAVTSKSTARQQLLGSRIRRTIAQKMIVESEKSIDLLQGLLTFIGWANHQVHREPFLAVFTQLAISLVFDLGLNKPVPGETPVASGLHKGPRLSAPRTMEERRAVLGCFLVTSIVSSFLQKIDTLRWTAHLDDCLTILDEEKECLNDDILVQQVRLQRIAEEAGRTTSHDVGVGTTENLKNIHGFLSQLESVKSRLFNASPKNVIFLHLHSIELEVALSAMFFSPNQSIAPQQQFLRKGLGSIVSWFEVFFWIPPVGYVGFPFSIFSQVVRCLTTLYRLATLDDPTWDKNHVQKTVKPLSMLNRVISNLEQVPVTSGLDNRHSTEMDVFSRSARILRSLRPEWEAKLGPDKMESSITPPAPNASNAITDPFGEEILNNDWFMDLLSSTFLPVE